MPADKLDGLARVVAQPMPRRQMVRLSLGALAGVVVAPGVLTRTALAEHGPGRSHNCAEYCASGTPCPAEQPSCCCADVAPKAWSLPLGGACYDESQVTCCRITRDDGTPGVVYCEGDTERCGGAAAGDDNCICRVPCGQPERCCPSGYECRSGECFRWCPPGWAGAGKDLCCPPGMVPRGRDCECTSGQRCGTGCCPFGFSCSDGGVIDLDTGGALRVCVGPPRPHGNHDTKAPYPGLKQAHVAASAPPGAFAAPKPRRRAVTVSTAPGAPVAATAAAGVSAPYDRAIVAVGFQGAAALGAWVAPRRDPRHRARVTVRRTAVSVTGLPAAAQSALARALSTEAAANARLLAAGHARGRSAGAIAAKNGARARAQAKDSGRHAAAAAKLYAALPAQRRAAAAALRSAGVAEVSVSTAAIRDAEDRVNTSVAADVAALLGRLGVSSSERSQIPQRVRRLSATDSAGGALIAPLEDPEVAKAYRTLARDLRDYAAQIRRKPIDQTFLRAQGAPRERS